MKQAFSERVLRMLYPRRCPVCFGIVPPTDQTHEGLCCSRCYPKLSFVQGPTCFWCGRRLASETEEYCTECKKRKRNFVRGVALLDYSDEVSSRVLWKLKYDNKREFADFLALEMQRRYGKLLRSFETECIVPVPVHCLKLRERGYNQAEILARKLGRRLLLPVEGRGLLRTQKTIAQKELTRQERYQNLIQAFCATQRMKGYQRVLLVDDIFTTGSTAHACTRALLEVGVRQVYLANFSIGCTEES